MTTFPPTVRNVIDGEDVNDEIANRPHNDLTARTDFLKEQLDKIQQLFQLLTKQDCPVGDTVLENQVVYFDNVTGKLQPAVAELGAVGSPPQFEPTARAFAVGIAQNIRGLAGSKICDLKMGGLLTATDLTNLIETTETIETGTPYWLTITSSEAGRTTRTRSGLEFMLGVFFSTTEFLLFPQLKALGEEHIHYRFEIDNADWIDLGPDVSLTGSATFTNGSSTVTGVGTLFTTEVTPGGAIKLDADDEYVRVDSIISDTELVLTLPYGPAGGAGASTVAVGPFLIDKAEFDPFPPIPFESTEMFLNGHSLTYGTDYTMTIDGLNYLGTDFPPTIDQFEVKVHYLLPISQSSPGVLSLKPATPNVLIENCSPGGPADTGNLKVSVIPIVDITNTEAPGSRALKTIVINPDGTLSFTQGFMVEKLIAGSGIALSPTGGQGTVTVTATTADLLTADIPDILLQNAKQSRQNLTSYIEFPEGSRSAFYGKIRLPETINTAVNLKFIFEMLGEASTIGSETISFELEYNIVDISLNQSINKPKLTQTKTITLEAGYVAYNAFTATVLEIPGTQLIPEATLSFSIRRLDTTDTYTGNVGVIHPRYQVKLT